MHAAIVAHWNSGSTIPDITKLIELCVFIPSSHSLRRPAASMTRGQRESHWITWMIFEKGIEWNPSKNHLALKSDSFQEQARSLSFPQIDFLNSVIDWRDFWQSLKHGARHLTCETHSVFHHTCDALVEVTRTCTEELGFSYVLLGSFKPTVYRTDLENIGNCQERSITSLYARYTSSDCRKCSSSPNSFI